MLCIYLMNDINIHLIIFSIGPMLKTLSSNQEPLKPHCDISLPPSPTTLDHLTAMRLRYHRLMPNPEPALVEWLGLMAGDQHASLRNLGTKIAIALQEVYNTHV